MERLINRRQQGDLGEASAIEWLTSVGARVFLPVGHSPDIDLVAEAQGRLLRIQVKTSTQRLLTPDGHERSAVALVTAGGNPELERDHQEAGSLATGLPLRPHGGWPQMVHSLDGDRGAELDFARRSQVLGVRSRAGSPHPSTRVWRVFVSRIRATRGGVSKRSKDGGCKPSGSAFAGSTPASPISA